MRKISVLMVDDEVLAMEHMRRLVDWDSLGFELADSVSNPKKALSIALELQPQLILADIRMPIMSGLELARSILEAGLRPRIVLLTSHKEFDYAKEAMKLGISDYWVKHEMDSASLTQELRRLHGELLQACELQEATRRQLLGELFARGSLAPEQWLAIAGTKAEGEELRLVVLRPDKPLPVLSAGSADSKALPDNRFEFIDKPEEGIEGLNPLCSVMIDDSLCVLYLENGVSEGRKRASLLSAVERLRGEYQRLSDFSASIAVSARLRDWRSLPNAYAIASRTLERTIFDGPKSTYFLESDSSPKAEGRLLWEKSVADLENAARARDAALLDEILDRLFEQAARERDLNGFSECCRQLLLILNRLFNAAGTPSIDRMGSDGSHDTDDERLRLTGIRDWFKKQFALALAAQGQSAAYSRKIRQALEHIREHYAEELTADSIAEQLGISRDHLRHSFKEETGQTVLDALTGVRIEQAKRLLREGRFKIYEIAEKVGYRNSQYFSQVFRKGTGMTPLEFVESDRWD